MGKSKIKRNTKRNSFIFLGFIALIFIVYFSFIQMGWGGDNDLVAYTNPDFDLQSTTVEQITEASVIGEVRAIEYITEEKNIFQKFWGWILGWFKW